jgi:hypothetical protein
MHGIIHSNNSLYYSKSAGNCPDANFTRSGLSEHSGAGAGRGSRRKNVIQQDDSLPVQALRMPNTKGIPHVGRPLLAGQQRLGPGWQNPLKQGRLHWNPKDTTEPARETFGLIEFTLPFLRGMQGHRHDPIPAFPAKLRHRPANQEVGQKRFKPESALIFVPVNGFKNSASRRGGGSSRTEMEFEIATIGAFKRCGDLTFERNSTTVTIRGFDEANPVSAIGADVSFRRRCPGFRADLARFRKEKSQRSIERLEEAFSRRFHELSFPVSVAIE